jgi:hypothetical protein
MTSELDHLIVPSRDRVATAQSITELLDVPWSEQGQVGPFSCAWEILTASHERRPSSQLPGPEG